MFSKIRRTIANVKNSIIDIVKRNVAKMRNAIENKRKNSARFMIAESFAKGFIRGVITYITIYAVLFVIAFIIEFIIVVIVSMMKKN